MMVTVAEAKEAVRSHPIYCEYFVTLETIYATELLDAGTV